MEVERGREANRLGSRRPVRVCARNEHWRFSHADENRMKMSTDSHLLHKKPNQSIVGIPCNILTLPTTATAIAVGL